MKTFAMWSLKTLTNAAVLQTLFLSSLFVISDFKYVTCGSVLKLVNPKHNVRLHSHEVKYGSGSGQQVKLVLS